MTLYGGAGRGVDDRPVDFEQAGFQTEVELLRAATHGTEHEAGRGRVVRDDVGQREPEVRVAAVDDLKSREHHVDGRQSGRRRDARTGERPPEDEDDLRLR